MNIVEGKLPKLQYRTINNKTNSKYVIIWYINLYVSYCIVYCKLKKTGKLIIFQGCEIVPFKLIESIKYQKIVEVLCIVQVLCVIKCTL